MGDTTPRTDAGKFDELVAATIRTAVDEWRIHNDSADVHGVSLQEYIRRTLADAGMLADAGALRLEWDDTHDGFTIVSNGAEAGQVQALVDTLRQVVRERDAARTETVGLSHALLLKGYRGFAGQVDAMARRIKELEAELAEYRAEGADR